MKERKITIAGKEISVAFNGATMISFEEITKKPFFEEKFTTQASRMALIFSAIYAFDENTDMTMTELMKTVSWKEMNEAFTIVMEASMEFFDIPEVAKQPEPTEEEKKNAKN